MSADIIKIAAFGVVAAVLAVTLRRDSPVFALLVGLFAGAAVVFAVLPKLALALDTLSGLSARLGAGARYVAVVIKIIGIAYAAEFGAGVCADAGEAALGAKVELAGKVLILATAMPVVMAMLEMITALGAQ